MLLSLVSLDGSAPRFGGEMNLSGHCERPSTSKIGRLPTFHQTYDITPQSLPSGKSRRDTTRRANRKSFAGDQEGDSLLRVAQHGVDDAVGRVLGRFGGRWVAEVA